MSYQRAKIAHCAVSYDSDELRIAVSSRVVATLHYEVACHSPARTHYQKQKQLTSQEKSTLKNSSYKEIAAQKLKTSGFKILVHVQPKYKMADRTTSKSPTRNKHETNVYYGRTLSITINI